MKLTPRAGRRLAAGIALACSVILLPAAAWPHRQPRAHQVIPPRQCSPWPAPLAELPLILSGASSR
jgi:hypothetical protein